MIVATPLAALGYIGPGAGLEQVGYALSLITTVGVAFSAILLWPVYTLLGWLRGKKSPPASQLEPVSTSSAEPVVTGETTHS